MTCGQYVWFRGKWNFGMSGFTFLVGMWELTRPWPWNWIFAVIVLASGLTNIAVALNWRRSWRFWHEATNYWLTREEIQKSPHPYLGRGYSV